MRGNFAVESAASLRWNWWQLCYGISGNFGVELMATFARNTQAKTRTSRFAALAPACTLPSGTLPGEDPCGSPGSCDVIAGS